MIQVTVWNEYKLEREEEKIASIYPMGIHNALAKYLNTSPDIIARTATLDEPDHGLTDEVLDKTDVLIWWGHCAHHEVRDDIVEKIHMKVLCGMGLIVLHSGHHSKIFRKLMGTSCNLKWRDIEEKERIWVIEPGHPIAEGIGEYIELAHEEMYGERFDIPEPDALVMIGWFKGGEVMRSGCCYNRGRGKVFYFQPGHESVPTFHHEQILKVIANAVRWARPVSVVSEINCSNIVVPLD